VKCRRRDAAPRFTKRKRVRLVAQAIRERWPVAQEQRDAEVRWLCDLVTDPETPERLMLAAARLLVEIDLFNLELERERVEVRQGRGDRRKRCCRSERTGRERGVLGDECPGATLFFCAVSVRGTRRTGLMTRLKPSVRGVFLLLRALNGDPGANHSLRLDFRITGRGSRGTASQDL
jgi:hypothetical protein